MTAALCKVSIDEARRLIFSQSGSRLTQQDQEKFDQFFEVSDRLWVGIWDSELLCIWGIIQESMLNETAYLWSYSLPALAKHKVKFARRNRAFIAELLAEFKTIHGHTSPSSKRWLAWLGACFDQEECGMIHFVIRQ